MEEGKQIKLDSSKEKVQEGAVKQSLLVRVGSYLNACTQNLSITQKRLLMGLLLALMAGFFIYRVVSGLGGQSKKLQNSSLNGDGQFRLSDTTTRRSSDLDSLKNREAIAPQGIATDSIRAHN